MPKIEFEKMTTTITFDENGTPTWKDETRPWAAISEDDWLKHIGPFPGPIRDCKGLHIGPYHVIVLLLHQAGRILVERHESSLYRC